MAAIAGRMPALQFAGPQPPLAVNHLRILPDGHAVDHRHGMHADERAVLRGIQHGAVDIMSVGVGSVEDDQFLVLFAACLHHII